MPRRRISPQLQAVHRLLHSSDKDLREALPYLRSLVKRLQEVEARHEQRQSTHCIDTIESQQATSEPMQLTMPRGNLGLFVMLALSTLNELDRAFVDFSKSISASFEGILRPKRSARADFIVAQDSDKRAKEIIQGDGVFLQLAKCYTDLDVAIAYDRWNVGDRPMTEFAEYLSPKATGGNGQDHDDLVKSHYRCIKRGCRYRRLMGACGDYAKGSFNSDVLFVLAGCSASKFKKLVDERGIIAIAEYLCSEPRSVAFASKWAAVHQKVLDFTTQFWVKCETNQIGSSTHDTSVLIDCPMATPAAANHNVSIGFDEGWNLDDWGMLYDIPQIPIVSRNG